MDNFKNIKRFNEGGNVMTKKHLVTLSTMHNGNCIYDVRFAPKGIDMHNGKQLFMVGKITPPKKQQVQVKEEQSIVMTTDTINDTANINQAVEIPRFMELARLDREYQRLVAENDRELAAIRQKRVQKKKTPKKPSLFTLIKKTFYK